MLYVIRDHDGVTVPVPVSIQNEGPVAILAFVAAYQAPSAPEE